MNPSALSPDQLALQARARELAAGPVAARAAEVDRTEQYPWDNVELLKDAKLIGMTIPTQYGGQGKGWLEAVLAIEQRDREHCTRDEIGFVRGGPEVPGIVERVLDVDDFFRRIDIAGDAFALRHADFHRIDGIKGGANQ